jgi:anti-sigma factor RsiW
MEPGLGLAAEDRAAAATSEVDCRRIAELLADYLDGTLPKGQREVIDAHIESCAPCLAFVNTYRCTVNAAHCLRE